MGLVRVPNESPNNEVEDLNQPQKSSEDIAKERQIQDVKNAADKAEALLGAQETVGKMLENGKKMEIHINH